MSNGFYFTPAELASFTADCTLDDNGNIVYGSAAAAVVQTAIKRAQRKSPRRKRHVINKKTLPKIKSEMFTILQEHPDIQKEDLSEALGFDRSTLGKNKYLAPLYEDWLRMNSNAAPATLNNDPNSYLDGDD